MYIKKGKIGMTKLYDWKKEINIDELEEVAEIIRNGGVVIFPTETVYGIGGNALNTETIKKIYEVKKRPSSKPLSILVKDKDEIEKYAQITSEIEKKIIDNFMPGPITLVLKKKENIIPEIVTAGNDTIGVRIPNNNIIAQVLKSCSLPIAAPSANISGQPSSTKLEDVIDDFNGKVDAMIDGGECTEKVSSTVVQVVDGKVRILREGVITIEDINKVLM